MHPALSPEYIDHPDQLRSFATEVANATVLAVDTEFVREETYFPILCLLQVASAERLALVDVRAILGLGGDLSPLFPVLQSPDCVKIMHAASQDLEVLYQAGAPQLASLFDTQVAAALLGHPDQIGYAALVAARLGITLDKDAQRTDWSRRPLSAQQLSYAADDVRHLGLLREKLEADLGERGRLDWLWQETMRLATPARYQPDPDNAWRRLKGRARLPGAAQTVARALAGWREQTAIKANRPRKWILADDVLYALAQKMPQDEPALAATGLPPATQRRYGDALLALIATARAEPETAALAEPELTAAERRVLKTLTEEVQTVASEAQIAPALLGTRAELLRVLRRDAHAQPLRGWRLTLIGERLLARLAS